MNFIKGTEPKLKDLEMNKFKKYLEGFEERFSGIYYGKDIDGSPNYPPEGFKEDVKQFLLSSLEENFESGIREGKAMMRKEALESLPRIRGTREEAIQAIFKDTNIGTLNAVELKEQQNRNEGFNSALLQIKEGIEKIKLNQPRK